MLGRVMKHLGEWFHLDLVDHPPHVPKGEISLHTPPAASVNVGAIRNQHGQSTYGGNPVSNQVQSIKELLYLTAISPPTLSYANSWRF